MIVVFCCYFFLYFGVFQGYGEEIILGYVFIYKGLIFFFFKGISLGFDFVVLGLKFLKEFMGVVSVVEYIVIDDDFAGLV